MSEPIVSVVVPTHNRPARLNRLLGSLRAQELIAEAFEVIVVDDGSDPATQRVLTRELERPGLTLRTARHDFPRGPGAARNSGWRMARAPLVAFTDDDCVASTGWLSAALGMQAEHPGAIIQGRTDPDPDELAHDGLLSRTVRVQSLGPQYETCNIFYPRETLESLGGFDESFGSKPAAEDTDLAWRAIERDYTTVFAPEALVLHAIEPLGVRGMLRVAWRWGGAVRVLADHPQTRSLLYGGVFWNVWHYLLWRSLLALRAPRWLRRVLIARHLLELRKRARIAGAGVWGVPFLIAHDLVECGAIARGAVRYRTIVL